VIAGLATSASIVVPDKRLQGMGIRVVHDEVVKIDAVKKTVLSSSGEEFKYDKLYMATSSSSFIPPIEGNDLEGVMTLRGLPDAEKIKADRVGWQPNGSPGMPSSFPVLWEKPEK